LIKNDKYLLAGCLDGSIRVLDTEIKQFIHVFEKVGSNNRLFLTTNYTQTLLLSGSYDKSISLFDLRDLYGGEDVYLPLKLDIETSKSEFCEEVTDDILGITTLKAQINDHKKRNSEVSVLLTK
jgi:WD40 repeat protein